MSAQEKTEKKIKNISPHIEEMIRVIVNRMT
jgi:hypothetical protein